MLNRYSTEDLQEELKKRKNRTVEKPEQLETFDLRPLMKLLDEYIEAIANQTRLKDSKHYIYEKAIETFYGKSVWHWINEHGTNY